MDKSPDAFRTISEVAEDLDLPQHVLRFWETRFNQIKPMKRGGGRRYYRPQDVDLIKGIRHMLYDQGYTIKGVQRLLKENGNQFLTAIGSGRSGRPPKPSPCARRRPKPPRTSRSTTIPCWASPSSSRAGASSASVGPEDEGPRRGR